MNNLYQKHNYLNKNIDYIRNTPICEYDMKNAGLNILFHNKILSKEEFDKLNSLDKLEKSIIVGKFLKNNTDVSDFMMEEYVRIRKQFFEENNIHEDQVLSIKKDAIFLIDKKPTITQLNENYKFVNKSNYTGYIYISDKEHYIDTINEKIDVKRYTKEVRNHHEEYLFKFLYECLKLDSINDKDNLFVKLLEFKHNYLNFNLDKEFYLDVNVGKYVFELSNDFMYYLDDIDDNLREVCNIQSNLNFIIKLIKLLM